jgi:hypothetical protein
LDASKLLPVICESVDELATFIPST